MKIWVKTTKWTEGKFLVVRRDGTRPHWPHFVLGARDPAAPIALRAYALFYDPIDPEFAASVRELADDFEAYRELAGPGDAAALPHRHDDPHVIAAMRGEQAVIIVRPDKGNVRK